MRLTTRSAGLHRGQGKRKIVQSPKTLSIQSGFQPARLRLHTRLLPLVFSCCSQWRAQRRRRVRLRHSRALRTRLQSASKVTGHP